jgi:hypothetical protein
MAGTSDVGATQSFGVAAETVVQNLLGREFGKGHDRSFASARFDVSFARAVATFASGAFGGFRAGGDALIVRVFVKAGPNIGMASAAHVVAHKSGSRARLRLRLQQ